MKPKKIKNNNNKKNDEHWFKKLKICRISNEIKKNVACFSCRHDAYTWGSRLDFQIVRQSFAVFFFRFAKKEIKHTRSFISLKKAFDEIKYQIPAKSKNVVQNRLLVTVSHKRGKTPSSHLESKQESNDTQKKNATEKC